MDSWHETPWYMSSLPFWRYPCHKKHVFWTSRQPTTHDSLSLFGGISTHWPLYKRNATPPCVEEPALSTFDTLTLHAICVTNGSVTFHGMMSPVTFRGRRSMWWNFGPPNPVGISDQRNPMEIIALDLRLYFCFLVRISWVVVEATPWSFALKSGWLHLMTLSLCWGETSLACEMRWSPAWRFARLSVFCGGFFGTCGRSRRAARAILELLHPSDPKIAIFYGRYTTPKTNMSPET